MKHTDFPLFLVLWNQKQRQSTPALHLRMARWLEGNWHGGNRSLLLMAFRSSGKSTIAGLFAAWLLYVNPGLRILVLAADQILAQKMVRQVRRIIEKHPLTKDLRPERADQWAEERFTVRRHMELRDPSMLARGIEANITGSRADIVICDDVEVPNTCDSAEKRENLRERLAEISYVLVPGGTQLYIGTPHTYHTIYEEFLQDFERLKIPVMDEADSSAWPEKFSPADIEHIRTHTGPNKFASQMMLQPVNIVEGRLNPALLNMYDEALDYTKELKTLFLGSKVVVSASAWWDPAFGAGDGDRSVLACVFSDAEGNHYLHRLEYIKTLPGDVDEATQQCACVADIVKELRLPSVTVEINGIGKFLPALLRNALAAARVPASVVEFSNHRPKDLRILESFDAVLAARRLYVHSSAAKTPFMTEMREWRPGSSRGHDDGLDAVAGALSQAPLRLKRLYRSGAQDWMRGMNGHKAKTEFDV
ncbi:MAG: phage terminase large subunit [Alphaproteobacteria bacterium]